MKRIGAQEPLLRICRLSKRYAPRNWFSRSRSPIVALDEVSLTIWPGSTLALVGESGSGKSTLAKCLARLEEPDSGEIWFRGTDVLSSRPRDWFSTRKDIQLILQGSATALNPTWSAVDIVGEPLRIHHLVARGDERRSALALMEKVGLSRHGADRPPCEWSGGQRQRLAIARAIALSPKLLILDEALCGLDLSIQAQIVNLLLELQASLSLTYLFITHDIRLAAHMADKIVIMQHGKIVEQGTPCELFSAAQHPHTQALLASVPQIDQDAVPSACA